MEINLELISIQNPWWEKKDAYYDPVLEKYSAQAIKWQPEIIKKIKADQDLIYCLQGSRGVGKTTILKLFIRDLLKKVQPENVLYYSCHNLGSYEQLNSLIKEFINWQRTKNKNRQRLYVVIDEISLLKKWQQGLDFLRQAGLFKRVTVLVSGSFMLEGAKNKYWQSMVLDSLSFAEFVRLRNPKFPKPAMNPAWYRRHHKELSYYLDIYYLTGGYVSALNSYQKIGAVKQGIYSNFLYWLTTDIAKLGRDVHLFKQIMEEIVLNVGRSVGYKTLAKRTKAKTHNTIADYADILESIFALVAVYQVKENFKPSASKAKKFYFRDPFLFWLFYSHVHGSLNYWEFSRQKLHHQEVFNSLVENVILSHLIKDRTREKNNEQVMFWRDNISKKSITFLVKTKKGFLPIIVDFDQAKPENAGDIIKKAGFREGIIIRPGEPVLDKDIKIMPLEYFLFFFNKILPL